MDNTHKRKFIARAFSNGDETSIVSLYNKVTGASRTLEQHKWEWLDPPEGQGSMWVIETTDTRQIVGHHGLIPIRFSCFGLPVLAGKTENTMIDPKFKSKLLYFPFETKFVEESEPIFDLLYTVEGSGIPGRIRRRLGYVPVGEYATYIKISKKSHVDKIVGNILDREIGNRILANIAKCISWPLDYLIMLFFFGHSALDEGIRLEKVHDVQCISDEIDELWDRNNQAFGITARRDTKYLKWRIFDNPNLEHAFFAARRGDKLIGYVIFSVVGNEQATIIDILADQNDRKTLSAIISETERILKSSGIHIIFFTTLASNNQLNSVFKANAFRAFPMVWKLLSKIEHREEPELLVKTFNKDLDTTIVTNPKNWYYTDILSEGCALKPR